jgi:Protein of unknown function (DUF2889)
MTSSPAHGGVSVAIGPRVVHPRHGIHDPRRALRTRSPGSIRRTSTIDSTRPGDILGDIVQFGVARDVRTGSDGTHEVLGEAHLETRIDYLNRYSLVEIRTQPDLPALQSLVGRSVSTGFRAALAEAIPDEQEQAALLHLLLDDLPGATLVSGYALGASGVTVPVKPLAVSLQVADLCAGFQRGGTIMIELDAGRRPPNVTGPPAPLIVPPDDALAWHELRRMVSHDMRRWRCLDVIPGGRDEPVHVEAYFRDSHVSEHGRETVIHEYTVTAEIDASTDTVLSSSATAHSLPWAECIQAEGSGDRLAGRSLRGLRPDVRAEFVGISTCTHLNDTLRSLEDVRALLRLL